MSKDARGQSFSGRQRRFVLFSGRARMYGVIDSIGGQGVRGACRGASLMPDAKMCISVLTLLRGHRPAEIR